MNQPKQKRRKSGAPSNGDLSPEMKALRAAPERSFPEELKIPFDGFKIPPNVCNADYFEITCTAVYRNEADGVLKQRQRQRMTSRSSGEGRLPAPLQQINNGGIVETMEVDSKGCEIKEEKCQCEKCCGEAMEVN